MVFGCQYTFKNFFLLVNRRFISTYNDPWSFLLKRMKTWWCLQLEECVLVIYNFWRISVWKMYLKKCTRMFSTNAPCNKDNKNNLGKNISISQSTLSKFGYTFLVFNTLFMVIIIELLNSISLLSANVLSALCFQIWK